MYSRRFRQRKSGYEDEQVERPAQAVALGYDPDKDMAPRVLASGHGVIAEQIIALAQKNGIIVYQDALLTSALASVDLDAVIPPELYALVAEVLAFVYRIQDKHP